MTAVLQPSQAAAHASAPAEPPKYPTVIEANLEDSTEKSNTSCQQHGASQTPHLDAFLHLPSTKARIHALSAALNDAAHGDVCTKCATENTARTLAEYLRDLRAAKKNGQWSHAEKKALKAEVKGLMKDLKRDMKSIWREQA